MKNLVAAFLLLCCMATPASAQTAEHPLLHEVADAVKPEALRATIFRLVGFGTRHSLSDQSSAARGIAGSGRYVAGKLK